MIVQGVLRETATTTPTPATGPATGPTTGPTTGRTPAPNYASMGPPAIPILPAMYPPTAVSGLSSIHLFAIGTDSFVYHNVYTGHTPTAGPKWGTWTRVADLDETRVSTEVAAVLTGNRLDVFALGTDHRMLHSTSTNTLAGGARQWSSWNQLGPQTWYSKPAAASTAADNIHVISTNSFSTPWSRYWNGTSWAWGVCYIDFSKNPYSLAPLTAFRIPNIVGPESLKVLSLTPERKIAESTWGTNSWSELVPLNNVGGVQSRPAAVGIADGHYMLFYLGDDSDIIHVDVPNSPK
jgi:hypothetical protein